MNKNITTSILGFTVLAALLTGCSAGATDLKPTVAPAATSTPVASAPVAAAPVATPVTGDVVDADTAAALKAAGEGQRAYPLDDGTFVVVSKTEPLPAAVQADIDVKAAAILQPAKDVSGDVQLSMTEPPKVQGFVAKNTGKRVIVAWKVYGYHNSLDYAEDFWIISGGPQGETYSDQASAQAVIDAWLAAKDDAATYTVVYVG